MAVESIGFTTRNIVGRGRVDGDDAGWSAQILAKRTVEEAEFFAAVAARTRQSVGEVAFLFSAAGETLRDFLRQGCHVNLSDVGFGLALTGRFPSADAAPDASRNAVCVRAHATRSLARALPLKEFNLVNVTKPLVARIFSVMDAATGMDGVIADPSRVLVTGEGLGVDAAAPDEGVRLVDAGGATVAEGTVLENDASSLDCSFAELPPPGAYRVEVRARNGADRSFAPAVVRKAIEVR